MLFLCWFPLFLSKEELDVVIPNQHILDISRRGGKLIKNDSVRGRSKASSSNSTALPLLGSDLLRGSFILGEARGEAQDTHFVGSPSREVGQVRTSENRFDSNCALFSSGGMPQLTLQGPNGDPTF